MVSLLELQILVLLLTYKYRGIVVWKTEDEVRQEKQSPNFSDFRKNSNDDQTTKQQKINTKHTQKLTQKRIYVFNRSHIKQP